MNPTIMIDAGHGGYDNGATYNSRREKDDNLRLALAVGQKLQSLGYPVIYTRESDYYQKPAYKAQIANESGADYFVSFHRNASTYPNQYSGVQTLVYDSNSPAAAIARSVNNKMAEVGFTNLGIEQRTDLAVLRRTKMPAILIEAGFIDTDNDNSLFDNSFNQLADGIAKGIADAVTILQ